MSNTKKIKKSSPGVKKLDDLKKKYKKEPVKDKPKKNTKKKIVIDENTELTHKEILFAEEYIKTQNETQSYLKISPKVTVESARVLGTRLLHKVNVFKYVSDRLNPILKEEEKKAVADANEILEFITAVVRGEVKDQLGFETSVKDRLTASKMLADRYRLFDKPKEEPTPEDENKNKSKVIIEVVDNSNLEKVLYDGKNNNE